MFQTVFSAVQNLGQLIPYKRVKRHHGRWQALPSDIMEKVLCRLNLSDRIRLSIVCKAWSSIVMRRDIRGAPQFPWLVLPQQNYKYLSFSIMPEGKVVQMKLPKRIRGWFHSSSNGWLTIFQEKGLGSKVLLWNPISRAHHQLPPLRTIPSFENHVKAHEWKSHALGLFVQRIELSSSNISECMVAAVFTSPRQLGLCRPGGQSWSVFQLFDDIPHHILFSGGMLYTLVGNGTGINAGSVITRSLDFGGSAVELKLVYDKADECGKSELQGACVIISKRYYIPYLVEWKANNEILLIHQIRDAFCSIYSGTVYPRTSDFTVSKFDAEKNSFLRVQSLVNQIVFLGRFGSLWSPASILEGSKGNVIYFESNGIVQFDPAGPLGPSVSNESGIFYLDGGEIVRSLPSYVESSTKSGESWFSPSL